MGTPAEAAMVGTPAANITIDASGFGPSPAVEVGDIVP
jgi:hypothetical protein